jgi:curli biogenesis system outer membrane secretion channel CsgG
MDERRRGRRRKWFFTEAMKFSMLSAVCRTAAVPTLMPQAKAAPRFSPPAPLAPLAISSSFSTRSFSLLFYLFFG